MNLNHVIIIGRLTTDPQIKSTPSGQSVTAFGIATNRVWQDKSGQKQESSEFHNVVLWGRTAEVVVQYCTKGSELLVEGRLQTRSWKDKQGNDRRITEIIGEKVQLGTRPAGSAAKPTSSVHPQSVPQDEAQVERPDEISAEDLPF